MSDNHKKITAKLTPHCEWVGGRLPSSVSLDSDGDDAFVPDVALWLDVSAHEVVAFQILYPDDPESAIIDVLLQAIQHPLAGSPRMPDTIRVMDEDTAALVREMLPHTPVTVAPAPELADCVAQLGFTDNLEAAPAEAVYLGDGYLGDGYVEAPVVEQFFSAAANLYRLAPWEFAADDQIIQVSAHVLGVDNAVISIMGKLGDAMGFAVFTSVEDYERFADHEEVLDSKIFSVTFAPGTEVPVPFKKEIARHAWEVVDPNAYPMLFVADPAVAVRPLFENDFLLATALCTALEQFFKQHGDLFALAEADPVVFSSDAKIDGGSASVSLRFPHPEASFVAIADEPVVQLVQIGRTRKDD